MQLTEPSFVHFSLNVLYPSSMVNGVDIEYIYKLPYSRPCVLTTESRSAVAAPVTTPAQPLQVKPPIKSDKCV